VESILDAFVFTVHALQFTPTIIAAAAILRAAEQKAIDINGDMLRQRLLRLTSRRHKDRESLELEHRLTAFMHGSSCDTRSHWLLDRLFASQVQTCMNLMMA
jgi:hypothetical protein